MDSKPRNPNPTEPNQQLQTTTRIGPFQYLHPRGRVVSELGRWAPENPMRPYPTLRLPCLPAPAPPAPRLPRPSRHTTEPISGPTPVVRGGRCTRSGRFPRCEASMSHARAETHAGTRGGRGIPCRKTEPN
jgi:hypothetical protein